MPKFVGTIICIAAVALFLLWFARFERGAGSGVDLVRVEAATVESEFESEVEELVDAVESDSRATVQSSALSSGDDGAADLAQTVETPTATLTAPWTARGVVLDPRGTPVAGMEIGRLGDEGTVLAETSGDGRFEVALEGEGATFVARGEGRRTVFAGVAVRHLADVDSVIMVARVVRMSGVVMSKSGDPIGSATMSLKIPWQGVIGFPRSLERSSRLDLEWRSDKDGTFDLRDVPVIVGIPLSTVAERYATTTTEVPVSDEYDMVIELQRIPTSRGGDGPGDLIIFGAVQDPEGHPVEGAEIFLGHSRTQSDASGRWEFTRGARVRSGTPLAAIHASLGGGALSYDKAWNGSDERIGPLVIELETNDLSIEGHVIDSEGQALEGWRVQLLGATRLSLDEIPAPTLERGGSTKSVGAQTDSDGHFKIAGLMDREYDIRAYSSRSYLSIERTGVPAGTSDLELRLAADAAIGVMRIHVRTRDGLAVPNATVQTRFIVERSSSGFTSQSGARGITDDEGTVTLTQVPRRGVDILASKVGIVTGYLYPGDNGFSKDEFEIQVDRNLEIMVDGSKMDPLPDEIRILDENGESLMISSRTVGGSTSSTNPSLNGGMSPVVTVSEAARELVLLSQGEETKRVPVRLTPGSVTKVEVP